MEGHLVSTKSVVERVKPKDEVVPIAIVEIVTGGQVRTVSSWSAQLRIWYDP